MKSFAVIVGISCLLAVSFSSASAQLDSLLNPIGSAVGGLTDTLSGVGRGVGSLVDGIGGQLNGIVGDLGNTIGGIAKAGNGDNPVKLGALVGAAGNKTVELVINVCIVLGVTVQAVQQILDGICPTLFKLYNGFLYPILDCVIAIIGIADALCFISEEPCTEGILADIASHNNSLVGLAPPQSSEESSGSQEYESDSEEEGGLFRRKRQFGYGPPPPSSSGSGSGSGSGEAQNGTVTVSPIDSFAQGFSAEDRVYAILTLRLLAVVIQITTFLSAHLHLTPIILCKAQRDRLGFNTAAVACHAAPASPSQESGGDGGSSGGLLGGLLGGGGGGSSSGGLLGGLLG